MIVPDQSILLFCLIAISLLFSSYHAGDGSFLTVGNFKHLLTTEMLET
jgi:hypothetical protein